MDNTYITKEPEDTNSGFSSKVFLWVEVFAVETTVNSSQYITYTAISATTIAIEVIGAESADAIAVTFAMKVNSEGRSADSKVTLNTGSVFTIELTFPATTLSLSLCSKTSNLQI